jgi:hypothetical protein
VLRVLALQLVFELGVGVGPEGVEIFCDLHRTMTRSEHMERQRVAAEGDFEFPIHPVEILNASG